MKYAVIIVCITLSFISSAIGERLIFVADRWEPVNGDPESETPGFVVEFADTIFTAAGYRFEYRVVPWARAVLETRKGKYSAVIGATRDNAKQLLFPTEPFSILNNGYFTDLSSGWLYQGPDSLKGEKVGVILGYHYGEIDSYLNENNGTDAVQVIGGDRPLMNNFHKLFSGRITVLVEWTPIVEYNAKINHWSDKIRYAGKGGNQQPLFLGFGAGRNDLVNIWDDGFQRLKRDGTVKRILEKYGVSMESIGL